jgi:hypothetical protein
MCTARSMADDSLVTMTAVTAADHERISGKACVQSRVCGCRSCSTNRHRRATSPRGGGCSQSLGMYNAFCFMMGVINTAATSPARCASNVHRCASTISSRPQSDRSTAPQSDHSQATVRPQSAGSQATVRPQSGRSHTAVRAQSDRRAQSERSQSAASRSRAAASPQCKPTRASAAMRCGAMRCECDVTLQAATACATPCTKMR